MNEALAVASVFFVGWMIDRISLIVGRMLFGPMPYPHEHVSDDHQ